MSARRESQQRWTADHFVGLAGRLRLYTFEIAMAATWAVVGIGYFIDPQSTGVHSAVGGLVHPYDYIWSTLYIIGGGSVIGGVLTRRQLCHVLGLVMLTTGLLMEFAAVALLRHEPRMFNYLLFAVACAARAVGVIRYVRA